MAEDNDKKIQVILLVKQAREALDRGDSDAAIDLCVKAIDLDSNCAEAYYNRGNAHDEKEEYDLAIADYSKAIELDPGDAEAYYNRGNAHDEKEEYDLAIADYSKAIELAPDDAEAYYNRGNARDKKGEYDLAFADYSKAIDLDPGLAEAHNNRGNVYGMRREYDLAIADYSKAIELDPEDAGAYSNRGIVYGLKEEFDLALEDHDKAFELDPDNALVHNNLVLEVLRQRAQEAADGYKRRYEEILAKTAGPDVAKQYQEREQEYSERVEELDEEIKQFSSSLPKRICLSAGAPVLALLVLGLLFTSLWQLLPLLSLALVALSYPSISQLRHMRQNRNRLEVCREDYVRKGIMAQYTQLALQSNESREATAKFQEHLADRSAAEFLSEWGKSAKDKDDKISWKSIIENNPVSPGAGDDRQV